MNIATMQTFFGWCAVINVGFLVFTSILIIVMRKIAIRFHSKMFNVDETFLNQAYFEYLGQYKIIVIVFSIVPYLALKIMG